MHGWDHLFYIKEIKPHRNILVIWSYIVGNLRYPRDNNPDQTFHTIHSCSLQFESYTIKSTFGWLSKIAPSNIYIVFYARSHTLLLYFRLFVGVGIVHALHRDSVVLCLSRVMINAYIYYTLIKLFYINLTVVFRRCWEYLNPMDKLALCACVRVCMKFSKHFSLINIHVDAIFCFSGFTSLCCHMWM